MKERTETWLNADIRTDLRRMVEWLKSRKAQILITFGWGVSIALVVIAYYWLLYIEHPEMVTEYSVIIIHYLPQWTPRILTLGYVIILLTSLIAGAILVDIGKVLFSFIASFFLSFIIAVLWGFMFVWFGLGVGQNSQTFLVFGGAASEWVLQLVLLVVFKMVFPLVPVGCLIAGFVGAIARALIQPSVEGA